MSHEIEQHDDVVLHRTAAWHGLGTVVENAPTPSEALQIAKLDWTVEQWPISATNGEKRLAIAPHVANIRTDINHNLGIVGKDYQPIQNRDLADFCEMLAQEGDEVRIESAGSIRNGAKVWFLLKGESFSVRDKDAVTPYILVSNGHDGGTALRCTPTTVRVVYSNTLHMVIPQFDQARATTARGACYYARHTKNVKERVAQARAALGLYTRSLEKNRQLIDAAAAKAMTAEQVKHFFLTCYTRDFGALDPTSTNKADQKRMHNARTAFWRMDDYFAQSLDACGATAWNAVNAYTEWLEHNRPIRLKSESRKAEMRLQAKLFGVDADRALQAFAAALAV